MRAEALGFCGRTWMEMGRRAEGCLDDMGSQGNGVNGNGKSF